MKLSEAQKNSLRQFSQHGWRYCNGEHPGTLKSLERLGLIEIEGYGYALTPAGRRALQGDDR